MPVASTIAVMKREISVVVPLYNEQEAVGPLVEAVRSALGAAPSWELVLVDDGSVDGTVAVAQSLSAADPHVRLIRLARNYGQTSAMQAGFDHSCGSIVVSMDGDLQNDPRDIPLLVETMRAGGYDLVTGYREKRQDKLVTRKIPSWIANRLIRWITGVGIRDNGCSLKAYRRELLERVHLYSDMHRFIPAVAAATAGARITEVPVRHHARRFGKSKYGLSRVVKVLADLLTIKMIRTFRNRPLVLFGMGAGLATLLGVAFAAGAGLSLLTFESYKARALVFPATALLWLGLAGYLLMLGLIAETAVKEQRRTLRDSLPLAREEM